MSIRLAAEYFSADIRLNKIRRLIWLSATAWGSSASSQYAELDLCRPIVMLGTRMSVCVVCMQHVRLTSSALRVYKIVSVLRTATVITSLETASVNLDTLASTVLEVRLPTSSLGLVYFWLIIIEGRPKRKGPLL